MTVRTSLKLQGRTRLNDAPEGSGAPVVSAQLSIRTIRTGTVIYRAHDKTKGALWFGPAGTVGNNRFDDPQGEYKICYLGLSEEAAFVEGVLHRAIPRQLISADTLAARAISEVHVVSSLRAVRLYGKYLVPTGATAAVTHGQSYALSQAWGRALYEHRAAPDGIHYHPQHDDEQMALALFDRGAAKIMAGTQHDFPQRLFARFVCWIATRSA